MTAIELAELAERALETCSGEAQATVTHERSLLSRFAHSAPTQATELDVLRVEVLCLCDGHAGSSSTTRTDAEALDGAARRARAAAEAGARAGAGDYPGLPAPGDPPRTHDGFDAASAQPDPAAAGRALAAAFAVCAASGTEAYGIWSAGAVRSALASSTGLRATDAVTDATMRVTVIAPGGRSGFAARAGVAAGDLDAGALAADAAERATRPGALAELGPGEYPVVLEAAAVGELLEFLGWLGFNGLAHAEGRGALSDRLGTRVAAPAINLADSPRARLTLPRAIDAEGVAKAPLPLIQDGVAHRVVHDTRSAARAGGGTRSTGHALVPGGDPDGPAPTNLVLSGGGAGSVEELCAPVAHGIYVTRLWYLNPVSEREALLTGVTRDGTFLIEDGRISRPLADVRFTDSVLRLLGAVEALGTRSRLVTSGEFYGPRFATGVVCPPLRADGFRVTGGAGG